MSNLQAKGYISFWFLPSSILKPLTSLVLKSAYLSPPKSVTNSGPKKSVTNFGPTKIRH